MLCYNPEVMVQTSYDNWLISPPFDVVSGKEYKLNYFYRNLIGTFPETMSLYWGEMPYPEDLTNLITTHSEFDLADWEEGSGLIIPEQDGLIYIGWHAESAGGLGILVDDVLVEDYGTVGLDDPESNQILRVYSSDNNIYLYASAEWQNSELRVMNLMGQLIHHSSYPGGNIVVDAIPGSGIYLVNLIKGDRVETRKVLVK
jgi:hypothetical protein